MRNESSRLLMTRETELHAECPVVIALGLFDGVHRAHQALITRAASAAGEAGGMAMVYTMSRNPLEIIDPKHAPRTLQPLPARVKRLFASGATAVLVRSFDPMFARLKADTFVRTISQRYHPSDIFVGFNYSFGAKGVGTPELLEKMSGRCGYKLHVLQQEMWDGAAISSTRIRQALEAGDIDAASFMLGRPYELYGSLEGGVLRVPARFVVPHPGRYSVKVDDVPTIATVQHGGVIRIEADGLPSAEGRKRVEICGRR